MGRKTTHSLLPGAASYPASLSHPDPDLSFVMSTGNPGNRLDRPATPPGCPGAVALTARLPCAPELPGEALEALRGGPGRARFVGEYRGLEFPEVSKENMKQLENERD